MMTMNAITESKQASRRPNGDGAIKPREKGNGTIVYDIECRFDGRRFYASGKTAAKAQRNLQEKVSEYMRGINSTKKSTTMDAWMRKWLKESVKPSNIKSSTYCDYVYYVEKFILPHVGTVKLTEFSSNDIRKVLNDLVDREYSHSLYMKVRLMLKMSLDFAVEEGLLHNNVLDSMKLRPPNLKKAKEGTLLLPSEKAILLEYSAKKSRLYYLLVLLFETGLRIGEATALKWSDLDNEKMYIRVTKAYRRIRIDTEKSTKTKTTTKTKTKTKTELALTAPKSVAGTRLVPLTEKLRAELEKWKKTEEIKMADIIDRAAVDEKFSAPGNLHLDTVRLKKIHNAKQAERHRLIMEYAAQIVSENTVFSSRNGTRCEARNLSRQLTATKKAIAKEQGVDLKWFTFHQARHAFASSLVTEMNLDPKTVMQIMGHKDIHVTLKYYTHQSAEIAIERFHNTKGNRNMA